jgi:hypothetical protein
MTKMNHQCDDGSCELDVLGSSFLKDLIPFTKTYAYDGELQLFDLIDSLTSNATEYFLLYSGEESIETIINTQTKPIIHISSFDAAEGLLLVKMPSISHGVAADAVDELIKLQLMSMGLRNAIHGFPNSTIVGTTPTRAKEPDYGWSPRRTPRQPGPSQPLRPSIVLEVTYTENDKKLNTDVRYWLSPNDGNVKMCLTLRIDRKNNEIRMESWTRREADDNNNNRAGIHRNQVIYARMINGRSVVTGDHPFRIPFDSLMLRPIDPSRAAEKDLLFSREDLEGVAEYIWDAEGEYNSFR